MRRKYILIVAFAIIVFFSEYFIIASWSSSITSSSELQDFANLPDIAVWLIVGFVIVILIAGLIALMSFAVKPLRRKVNESLKHSKHKRLSNEAKLDEN